MRCSFFESCTYPNAIFKHQDHLRLAWLYLRKHGYEEAQRRMRESIFRYASNLGASEKYHESVTIAWVRLVNHAIGLTPNLADFTQFAAAHPWLMNRDALLAFYSRERLFSDGAWVEWVEPDLYPLPTVERHKKNQANEGL